MMNCIHGNPLYGPCAQCAEDQAFHQAAAGARPTCIKGDGCWSPIACNVFGHCRDLNGVDLNQLERVAVATLRAIAEFRKRGRQ